MTKLEHAFELYNQDLIHLQSLYIKYANILNEQFYRKKFLVEGQEEQRLEIIQQINDCCKNIQGHVLYILNLLEEQQIISIQEINEVNRIHIDSMGTYRYLMIKAKLFSNDEVIIESSKKLKECKERLQHNIECYNNFLIRSLSNTALLLTPNEAIKVSKEEEDKLLKNIDL